MARTLATTDLGRVEARAWPGLVGGLLARGEPRLACARLSGGVVSLGRWQRADAVLNAQGLALAPVRRVTGGRAMALGDGLVAVALVVPHRSWLVSDDPGAVPAASLLNRGVRGILAGLTKLGIAASYGGRDFVTVKGAQAGSLSFEIAASGAALVECILPAEAHWWLPAAVDALPARAFGRGFPAPARIERLEGVSSTAVLEAIARGHSEVFGLSSHVNESAIAPDAVTEQPAFSRRSTLHAVPCGWAGASVRIEDGRLVEVAFEGDFLADSAGLAALRAACVGLVPGDESLLAALHAVYAEPGRAILGLPDLSVFSQAIVEAAS